MEVDEDDNILSKNIRTFDHKRYARRHVLLMVAYVGWEYDGFVVQENVENTIEKHLFDALTKTMLIESRETSNYHRCGRTDKGVSGFRQVISIDVRSNLSDGIDVFVPDGHVVQPRKHQGSTGDESRQEYNYPSLLNRVLPAKIRILAWASVPKEFSSRFDCKMRSYRYYFPRGNLNLEVMQEACKHLLGEHDFRNFCKVDMTNNKISHCYRGVAEAKIVSPEASSRFDLCYLSISAQAFLWHQIRCIMSVLLLIGEGKEQPKLVADLLNVEEQKSKPHYPMAVDYPLVLHDCRYDDSVVHWRYDENTRKRVVADFQRLWTEYAAKAKMLQDMAMELESTLSTEVVAHTDALFPGNKSKNHIPLLKRHTGDSVEEKRLKSAKKAKLKNGD